MLNIRLKKLRKTGIARDEKGFTLVEAVISIALIGIIVAGLFTGLGTASKVLLRTDARETAKNLAETQMEYIKGQAFNSVYTKALIPAAQQGGYTASINVINGSDTAVFGPDPLHPEEKRNSYLQKIIVTITGPGITYTLEGYKAR
jgi:prepilin-type N-terminal cleavage/methylation domain-containing protein